MIPRKQPRSALATKTEKALDALVRKDYLRVTGLALRRSALATSKLVSRDRAKTEKELDKLCTKLVVHLRDHGICQRCGSPGKTRGVQWCHVFTRGYKRLSGSQTIR